MKEEQDAIKDIADIRSMMERSSKFLSLSGLAGVMAGIYALAGAIIAIKVFHFRPDWANRQAEGLSPDLTGALFTGVAVLMLAVATTIFLSSRKAEKAGEKIWNATTRRLLEHMFIPLAAGGLLALIMLINGLIGLIPPITLIFYGLAIYNAGRFTFYEVRSLGIIQVILGLIGACCVEYGVLLWALGFGVIHIGYGIYMHYKYER